MRNSEKRMVISEVSSVVGFGLLVLLIFWGYAQIADPRHISLVAQIPWTYALAISIMLVICVWVSEKFARFPEQNIKKTLGKVYMTYR